MTQAFQRQSPELQAETNPQPARPNPARLGPRPLPLHLTTALCAWPSLPIVWDSLKKDSPISNDVSAGLKPDLHPARLETIPLRKLRAAAKLTNPAFERALANEALSRTRAFLNGVRAYQNHPDRRDVSEAPVIWNQGSTKLRDYNPADSGAPVVLVIPSLINRFDVLDLDFAPSFLRTLAAYGFRPLVVDWDWPGEEEKTFGLGDYVGRLAAALDFIQTLEIKEPSTEKKNYSFMPQTAPPKPHILGYCMGGLLALALATLRPHQAKSLSLLATPWDFHKPDDGMGKSLGDLARNLEPYLERTGFLPVDVIQALFAILQPLQVLQKFTRFAAMNPFSMEARKFVLAEDWLNDGVPLTARAARECLQGWYGENQTAKNQWRVGDRVIDPRRITAPSYVLVPGKDKIVPPESALPLAKLLPHAALHEPMTGHIGLMASRHAPQQIWGPLIRWLEQRR